jgi:hypothetical protein
MIQFIIRHFNDHENLKSIYDQLSTQIDESKFDHKISIYDDGSDELPDLPGVIDNGINEGELQSYCNIRDSIEKPYIVFIDSDDILELDSVKIYETKVEEMRNHFLNPMKVLFNYKVIKNGILQEGYSQLHTNSMAYDLIDANLYLKYTKKLGKIIFDFEDILGYDKINNNSDTYLSHLLNLKSALDSVTYFIPSSQVTFNYVVSSYPSQNKYIDRERFLDGKYQNIYDNPKLKERFELWKMLVLRNL